MAVNMKNTTKFKRERDRRRILLNLEEALLGNMRSG
jgi:hypothetical protein